MKFPRKRVLILLDQDTFSQVGAHTLVGELECLNIDTVFLRFRSPHKKFRIFDLDKIDQGQMKAAQEILGWSSSKLPPTQHPNPEEPAESHVMAGSTAGGPSGPGARKAPNLQPPQEQAGE